MGPALEWIGKALEWIARPAKAVWAYICTLRSAKQCLDIVKLQHIRDCRSWLAEADRLIGEGKWADARGRLQQLVDGLGRLASYPGVVSRPIELHVQGAKRFRGITDRFSLPRKKPRTTLGGEAGEWVRFRIELDRDLTAEEGRLT